MGKRMQVYIRLFPLPKRDWKYIQISKDLKDLYIQSPTVNASQSKLSELSDGKQQQVDKFIRFQTSGIFENNTQEELYYVISKDIFPKIFIGENVIIMANGQHGSGKSFTMTGFTGLYENHGLALRLVNDLFDEINQRKRQLETEVYLSHIDFASETIIDLLTEPASNLSNFNQATRLKIKNKEQLVKTILHSEKRRWIENFYSHCSTSVMTIYLRCKSKIQSEAYDYYPRIQLVELSGVEPVKNGPNECQRKANKDMAAMSLYLASRKSAGLSRSSSKLVCFLADTWNNSFIRIISHLIPTVDKSHLNMSTLIFTSRLMQRPLYSLSFQRIDNAGNSLQYALEMIKRLEEELIVREMITGDGFRHTETVTQKEMDTILAACTEFLEGNLSLELLLSIAHPHLLIRAFKKKFDGLQIRAPSQMISSTIMQAGPPQKYEKMQKISIISKKKMGPAKKTRSSIDGEAMSSSDDVQLADPVHPQGIPDRQTIETEFYTRYPELKVQLDLAEENYLNALSIRNEVYKEYERLKKEAREEKELEDDLIWKKRLELGECVGRDGRPVWTTYAERPAQDAAIVARRDMADALHAFTAARDTLTELKTIHEEKIQGYLETAYGLWIPTLDPDEPKECYLDKLDSHSELNESKSNMNVKMKNIFYSIQREKKNSSPYSKKPTWV